MYVGKVIGSVWSTVKWPGVQGLKLLTVQPYHLSQLTPSGGAPGEEPTPCHDLVVCADVLGAGVGEDVIIAYGHAARVALEQALGEHDLPSVPVDAAVVAIVDQMDLPGDGPSAGSKERHHGT